MKEAKIYVGTYGKYSAGSIAGKWLDLSDYSDAEEFFQACAEIHKDERDPEYMFQDYEGIPAPLINESYLSYNFWELRDLCEDMDEDTLGDFIDWVDEFGYNFDEEEPSEILEKFEESYCGRYDSKEQYAEELIDECYNLEQMMGGLSYYFDYSAFARDLFMFDYSYNEDTGAVYRIL